MQTKCEMGTMAQCPSTIFFLYPGYYPYPHATLHGCYGLCRRWLHAARAAGRLFSYISFDYYVMTEPLVGVIKFLLSFAWAWRVAVGRSRSIEKRRAV